MPPYPIEVLNFGNPEFSLHETVLNTLNGLQDDIVFSVPRPEFRNWADPFHREAYTTDFVWKKIKEYRAAAKGFHPFVIAIVHGELRSDQLGNLFGSHEANEGMAVFTTHDWETTFAPPPLSAFVSYYLVRYTLSFVCPAIRNHEARAWCFWHKKMFKPGIKESMKAGKICDECRSVFEESVNPSSYASLQKLVTFVQKSSVTKKAAPGANGSEQATRLPRVFIGSSTKGLAVAEHLQLCLHKSADVTVWSQGPFGLSEGSLEALVKTAPTYDFAVLVLSPDDVIFKKNKKGNAPRDNVLFELGLFMGAVGRERTYMVMCEDDTIALPSDLAGVTYATYRRHADGNLAASLGAACVQLKNAMSNMGLQKPRRSLG